MVDEKIVEEMVKKACKAYGEEQSKAYWEKQRNECIDKFGVQPEDVTQEMLIEKSFNEFYQEMNKLKAFLIENIKSHGEMRVPINVNRVIPSLRVAKALRKDEPELYDFSIEINVKA